jgi:hypothetical protein
LTNIDQYNIILPNIAPVLPNITQYCPISSNITQYCPI